MGSLFEQPRN
ncbi:unnamed protein product, partial [Diplocarpon coronariae]